MKFLRSSSVALALGAAIGFALGHWSPLAAGAGTGNATAPPPVALDPRAAAAAVVVLTTADGGPGDTAAAAAVQEADTQTAEAGAASATPAAADPGLAEEVSALARANAGLLADLRARVTQQDDARRALTERLEGALTELATLRTELRAVAEVQDAARRRMRRWRGGEPVTAGALAESGYAPEEAAYLAQRHGEEQMELLYLRDQARREGWRGTDRFREARRDLRSGPSSMRHELGDEGYDTFLYRSGQSNRLAIEQVIEASPAQAIGLRPGDVIVRYDGQRMFSWSDLRTSTAGGVPDELVRIEVQRQGQVVEYQIPRGPLGVTTEALTVSP